MHSFVASEIDAKYVCGESYYGTSFPSFIEKDNIFGAQFHPEKSQKYGLQIIENFLNFTKNIKSVKEKDYPTFAF